MRRETNPIAHATFQIDLNAAWNISIVSFDFGKVNVELYDKVKGAQCRANF